MLTASEDEVPVLPTQLEDGHEKALQKQVDWAALASTLRWWNTALIFHCR
jgi:hypothetical protein